MVPILYDLYDLAHLAGWGPHDLYMAWSIKSTYIPGLDLYY